MYEIKVEVEVKPCEMSAGFSQERLRLRICFRGLLFGSFAA